MRARLQAALQGLWGGKIIHRAIIWWVTIISSLLSSTFSRLCCSWLPALHLLLAESNKANACGRSQGMARACDGSVFSLFAPHQQLALVVTGSQCGTPPATHPLEHSAQPGGDIMLLSPQLCALGSAWLQSGSPPDVHTPLGSVVTSLGDCH